MQLAIARADVALEPTVLQTMPVAPARAAQDRLIHVVDDLRSALSSYLVTCAWRDKHAGGGAKRQGPGGGGGGGVLPRRAAAVAEPGGQAHGRRPGVPRAGAQGRDRPARRLHLLRSGGGARLRDAAGGRAG